MPRYYIQVNVNKMYTTTSGDVFQKEGEWYFDVNGQRFPHKGEFKLSKNETLEFSNPKPTLYAGMLDSEGKEFKLKLRVKESDVIRDDTFLTSDLALPWGNHDQDHEFVSKDKKVTMSVRVLMVERTNW